MKQETTPNIFAAGERDRWHTIEPGIWSVHGADLDSIPAQSILTTLWDQPRWLEAYHLYDQRGSELFEQICELPEYYLTRTENAILETMRATSSPARRCAASSSSAPATARKQFTC